MVENLDICTLEINVQVDVLMLLLLSVLFFCLLAVFVKR